VRGPTTDAERYASARGYLERIHAERLERRKQLARGLRFLAAVLLILGLLWFVLALAAGTLEATLGMEGLGS